MALKIIEVFIEYLQKFWNIILTIHILLFDVHWIRFANQSSVINEIINEIMNETNMSVIINKKM